MKTKGFASPLALALAVGLAACSSDNGSTDDAGTGNGDANGNLADGGGSTGKDGGGKTSGPDGSVVGDDAAGDDASGDDDASNPPTTDGGANDGGPAPQKDGGQASGAIKTVFIIVMENHNWTDITGGNAPYIKGLLPKASYCDAYYDNPKAVHPSEPNYMWLEAADNLGFTTDDDPSASHKQTTTDHLTSQLTAKGVSWKSYQEDLPASSCGTVSTGGYAAKHNPMVFFTDVSGDPPSDTNANCMQHVKPYSALAGDLAANAVAQYNFITPNLCDDMHDTFGCKTLDAVSNGDTWLSTAVPAILASQAYKNGGALFITWDESEGGEKPIGMIVLSPLAKGGGFISHTKYYHSSFVRTVEEIFGTPFLRDANAQSSLKDLFTTYP